jgi:hypothetical protein
MSIIAVMFIVTQHDQKHLDIHVLLGIKGPRFE